MDFGEILKAWESGRGRAGRSRPGKRLVAERPALENALEVWLRTHDIPDKDAEMEAHSFRSSYHKGEHRRRLLALRPQDTIDLHGETRDEAWRSLELFFDNACQRGLEKVLIIHGKGNHSPGKALDEESVLTRTTRQFIEQSPLAGESGQAGNSGSTWVLIRNERRVNVPDR